MTDASTASPDEKPILLRLRSGKIAAAVIGFGIGGGTLLLGVASTAASAAKGAAVMGAIVGYGLAVLPLFVVAGVIAVCKSELWLLPQARTLRMLTYRPWLRSPRVEEASLSEYSGVRTSKITDDYGAATLVSLVTTGGEDVPLRQFSDATEATAYAAKLGEAAGLWVREAEPKSDLKEEVKA
ncbi:MAG: hypothetical protein IPK82_41220 [Polyangiaceae bacterium]|nr:hypothetical protein [Polyangiaceae bacterium]